MNTLDLAAQRRAELMAELRRLDVFVEMARELEGGRATALPTAAPATFSSTVASAGDTDAAGDTNAESTPSAATSPTEAGKAIVKGFKPRHMPGLEEVGMPTRREETAPSPAPRNVENMFEAC